MRIQLFTPRQPIPDVKATSQEWKPNSEIFIKHDNLYARAWEPQYKTPNFDNIQHEPDVDNSPELTVRHNLANDELCISPGSIKEASPEVFAPDR